MLELGYSTRIKKDLKKFQYKKEVIKEFNVVIKLLSEKKKLSEKYLDHDLSGNYYGYRECHVKPDVLLVYRVNLAEKVLYLARIGSHSELF